MRVGAISVVLTLNAALVVALALLWSDKSRLSWTEPQAIAPTLPETAAPPQSEPAEVSRYRQTLERPLFAANRRPAPRPDPAAREAVDTLKEVRLLGTYGAGSSGGIIVVSSGKVQRIAVGENIGGWKVTGDGSSRTVELVHSSGERRRIELALNSTAPAAPARSGPRAGAAPTDAAVPTDRLPPSGKAEGEPGSVPASPAPIHDATSKEAVARDEQLRKERLERINQRRAARGLKPLGR
jgi:Tfp pilus assembly protein PilP